MKALHSPHALDAALLAGRLALGLYFFFAGFCKVQNELRNGLGTFARGPFSAMRPAWLPEALGLPYGYALPWIEVVLGALLTLGIFGVTVAALTSLVLLSIMIAQLFAGRLFAFQAAYEGPGPFHNNVMSLALGVLLTVAGPGRYSIDAMWRKKRPA